MTQEQRRPARTSGARTPPPVNRLSEQAWVRAALSHIARNNVDDIRIEELARELNVTKGSFYWHFRNRQHLVEKMLEYWMERATIQVTRWARAENSTGADRLCKLLSLPASTPPDKRGADMELAIRSWARRERLAAETVREVDAIRRDFFIELMHELGFSGDEAARRASIAQSFMLGEALLCRESDRSERLATVQAFVDIAILSPPQQKTN